MNFHHLHQGLRRSCVVAVLCIFAPSFWSLTFAQSPPTVYRFTEPQEDFRRVLELVEQRLALMPDVAAWKWEAKQPIVDSEREAQVLDRSVADAIAMGLDADAARRFFELQIRMARSIQYRRFDDWRQPGAQVPKARDLNKELRPALDALGRDLLVAIYLASNSLSQSALTQESEQAIDALRRHRGVEALQLVELRSALVELRIRTPATLDRVQRVGVLRVGTTGDYAPFSAEQVGAQGRQLRGFDIQLAADLAKHWHVAIQFVRTSWPTLMSDYQQQRFDIAVSGISVTPERAALAGFSLAYHVDGKTPIVRCADEHKFSSLKNIDRASVRVIENPGGTNERFAREYLSKARVTIHADNNSIFEELIARRADVMFTDGIEVAVQVRRHSELCGSMTAPLTRSTKAILLPSDTQVAHDVNEWLGPQLLDGRIASQLQQAVQDAK